MTGQAWTSTREGRHLAGRRNEGTAPEIAVRRALHAAGARFRLHPTLARGCRPDLVLPRRRIAVWVDGCWWHSCPDHGCKTPFTGPNADLWQAKLARTTQRDREAVEIARSLGWAPVRVWEHEAVGEPAAAAARVLAAEPVDATPTDH